jgi:S-adenosylmethionine/arginine decarboxylase-like enzyme
MLTFSLPERCSHEVFVHYPARFLQRDIKRVAFIGGGDNMIVHEILKYTSLELVVGLELDQEVVRSSFLNFGTQPHFDVPELQWWFGDASKSLLMLPEEYYGSFDLVLVDLQNDVVEILKVTEELGFMDAAMLLVKEDGVIARNEDWEFHTSEPFTDYTVDLFYVDVPLIAHQGITLGSNTVDFVTQPLKDHGVETIYMKPVEQDGEDRFDKWYNYRKSSNHTAKLCPEPGSSGDKPLLTEELRSRLGILIAIEAEDVSVPLQSSTDLQAAIREALKAIGVTETAVQLSPEREEDDDGYEIVIVLQEGYLVARAWAKHKYCAFDLMLWSNTDKLEIAKAALVDSVGSKSVSSYRIVMGGMSGVTSNEESRVGPRVAKSCDKEEDVAKEDTAAMEKSTIEAILTETATLIQDGATILVLCGEESDRPCSSFELLKEGSSTNVIPLYTCPDLDTTENMLECETRLLENLEEALGNDKIGCLVIDSEAPRAIGQIVHHIFDNTRQRRRLLADSHVVVSLSADSSNSGWHKALLDRFRTDMVIFDPAYRADVALDDVELGVFSSGDSRFYTHLTDAMTRVQDKTGVTAEIQDVTNGINNYIAGFVPSKTFTHDDYDDTASLQQWNSQQPLGDQTVSQYTTEEPLSAKAIKPAFEYALYKVAGGNDRLYLDVYNVGTGCVIVAFWSHGSAVLTFDGNSYMSVNIFSTHGHGKFTKAFEKKISDMSLTMMKLPENVFWRENQSRQNSRLKKKRRECPSQSKNVRRARRMSGSIKKCPAGSKNIRLIQKMSGNGFFIAKNA